MYCHDLSRSPAQEMNQEEAKSVSVPRKAALSPLKRNSHSCLHGVRRQMRCDACRGVMHVIGAELQKLVDQGKVWACMPALLGQGRAGSE